jgi:hypothetical protein
LLPIFFVENILEIVTLAPGEPIPERIRPRSDPEHFRFAGAAEDDPSPEVRPRSLGPSEALQARSGSKLVSGSGLVSGRRVLLDKRSVHFEVVGGGWPGSGKTRPASGRFQGKISVSLW